MRREGGWGGGWRLRRRMTTRERAAHTTTETNLLAIWERYQYNHPFLSPATPKASLLSPTCTKRLTCHSGCGLPACRGSFRPRPSVRPSTCHSSLVHDPLSPPSFLRQIPAVRAPSLPAAAVGALRRKISENLLCLSSHSAPAALSFSLPPSLSLPSPFPSATSTICAAQ